jgi:Anaphase-promoting complex subunit 11 RING-H2 finger
MSTTTGSATNSGEKIFRDIHIALPITDSKPATPSSKLQDPLVIEDIAKINPGVVVRLITPASAQRSDSALPLLYNEGKKVPLNTTLRELKIGIANLLGIQNLHLPVRATAADRQKSCNCSFATSITENGLWEMLRCRIHDSPDDKCDYPHTAVNKSKVCPLCYVDLAESCEDCSSLNNSTCPLVVNAGCAHTFHYHCYRDYSGDNCPAGCPRGMVSLGSLLTYRYHAARDDSGIQTTNDHRGIRKSAI